MSKYKLNFKLKQHTPIIHFQWDQEGATLRASELKPKLDKFLIDKLALTKEIEKNGEHIIVPKKEYEHWFNNKEKLSLDYKVGIFDDDQKPSKGTVIVMPPKNENWILSKDIFFKLITFHLDLKNEIEKVINLFFCISNFGKRQSKGFGCFYPENLSEKEFIKIVKDSGKSIYEGDESLRNGTQISTYFYDKIISKKWNELKSGLNLFWLHKPVYKKSEIFKYLESKNLRWDKRWIKRNVKDLVDTHVLSKSLLQRKPGSTSDPIDIHGNNSWIDFTDEEYRFGRAMLGLAEHYEYQTVDKDVKYKVRVLHNEIERFKSPVIFKIFDKSIFAIAEDIPSEMYDTPFTFEVQKKTKTDNEFRDDGAPISIPNSLRTPTRNEFNLLDFLSNHFRHIGFKKL